MADFTMFSGDTKVLQITVTDEAGAAIDLTGVDLVWVLAKKVTAAPLVTKEIGTGITITDAAAGKFEVAIAPADTENIKGDYYHECQMDAGGAISTIMTGKVTITPDAIKV
jgi:hypothetical protein